MDGNTEGERTQMMIDNVSTQCVLLKSSLTIFDIVLRELEELQYTCTSPAAIYEKPNQRGGEKGGGGQKRKRDDARSSPERSANRGGKRARASTPSSEATGSSEWGIDISMVNGNGISGEGSSVRNLFEGKRDPPQMLERPWSKLTAEEDEEVEELIRLAKGKSGNSIEQFEDFYRQRMKKGREERRSRVSGQQRTHSCCNLRCGVHDKVYAGGVRLMETLLGSSATSVPPYVILNAFERVSEWCVALLPSSLFLHYPL